MKSSIRTCTAAFSLACLIILSACQSNTQEAADSNKTSASSSPVSTAVSTATKAPSLSPSYVPEQDTEQAIPRGIPATITRVVDGDTMQVDLSGKKETIRLLLVDTPETVHPDKPVEPFGPEASAFAKETLTGKKAILELDVSERDKYGRLLCYLWVDGVMFNEALLEKGLARVAYIYPPNVKYVDQFRVIQDKARQAEIGIWSIENYATDRGFNEDVKVGSTTSSAAKPTNTGTGAGSVGISSPSATPRPSSSTSSAPASTGGSQVYFKNCSEARAAGAAPVHIGDPGYGKHLDRDGDGIGCE
ncbi:thermonuclease family protein [Gorillibacterium massiliense]|uniref:thermonuclease family protein n=1 Tax=Gorillibacterium massiliense TaxID=1280390 RepID=UPI0005927A56|nr:thermonuclease family protein [Gorillibacterium massiliense]